MASGGLFSPIAAYFNKRFSYRFTAIVGSFCGTIGFFLASWSSKLWMMYITYGFLSGFGFLLVYMSSTLIVLQYFVKWRSVAVGIVASAPAIGMFVMTQITQSLLTRFAWRGALRGFGILFFVCGLCSTVFVPLEKLKEERSNNGTLGEKMGQKETKRKARKETASKNPSLCGNYAFLILSTSFFVVMFAFYVPVMHIVRTCRSFIYFIVTN